MLKLSGLQIGIGYIAAMALTIAVSVAAVLGMPTISTADGREFTRPVDPPDTTPIFENEAALIRALLSPDASPLGGADSVTAGIAAGDEIALAAAPEVVMVVNENGALSAFLRDVDGLTRVETGSVWNGWDVDAIELTQVLFSRDGQTHTYVAFASPPTDG